MGELELVHYQSFSEINENQWNNLVRQSPEGSVFHRSEWLKPIEFELGYEPHHLAVYKDTNPIAIFPLFKRTIPLPESNIRVYRLESPRPGYPGPLAITDRERCLTMMLNWCTGHCKGRTLYHRIKTKNINTVKYSQLFHQYGYRSRVNNCRVRLNIERMEDEILGNMDKERRRAVRKAESQQFSVNIDSPDEADIDAFFHDYLDNMERINGTRYPHQFFARLNNGLNYQLKLATASVKGSVVGRYLYIVDEGQSTFHHILPAISDVDNYEHHPSELLHMAAIRWGKDAGLTFYDFGESGADFRNSQLKHKLKYGGAIVPTLQWEGTSSLAKRIPVEIARTLIERRARSQE